MDENMIEAITDIIEANEYFLRSVTEEFVRLNNNIANLLWWNINETRINQKTIY